MTVQPDFDLLLKLHAELGEGAIALRELASVAVRRAQMIEDQQIVSFTKAAYAFALNAQAISQTAVLAVGAVNNEFDRLKGEADDAWTAE